VTGGETFPALSLAVRVNVCDPAASPEYDLGEVHVVGLPPSRVQVNVLPASVEVNLKVAEVWLVGLTGELVMVAAGSTVSIVHLQVAVPALPASSVAVMVSV
jgi:hypothetical protein